MVETKTALETNITEEMEDQKTIDSHGLFIYALSMRCLHTILGSVSSMTMTNHPFKQKRKQTVCTRCSTFMCLFCGCTRARRVCLNSSPIVVRIYSALNLIRSRKADDEKQ